MEHVYCVVLKLLIIFISLKFFNCHVSALFIILIQAKGVWYFMNSFLNQGMSKIKEGRDSFSQMPPHIPTVQTCIYMYAYISSTQKAWE